MAFWKYQNIYLESVTLKKTQPSDLSEKDFKTTILNMDKELKDIRKTMYEQKEYQRDVIGKTNRNSGGKNYNNWIEKFIRKVQQQTWTGRKKELLNIKKVEIIKSEKQKGKKKWRKVNKPKGLMGLH